MSTTNQVLPRAVQDLLTSLSGELTSSSISTLRLVDDALSNLLRATVRTHLNECTAVNRLPPEVLSAIFDLLRSGSSYCGDIDGRHHVILRPDTRSLIAVTHVCRRWRDVSLGCAQLWTNISTISPLAPKFFERSREMSLTVFVSLVRGRPPPVPKQVFLNQLPRIKVLHIDLECSAQIRHWRKHLQSLAKSLESLTVVTHGHELHARANPLLIRPFFGTECPISLRFLSVLGVTALFPADHFPALEHVHLSMSSFSSAPFDHFERPLPWILLTNAPRLQTFHLHFQPVALRSSFMDYPALPQVGLPMMRHLCITLPRIPPGFGGQNGHYGAVRAMLANLDLPRTAAVSIQETRTSGRLPDLYIPYATDAGIESVLTIGSRETAFAVRGHPGPTTYFRYASAITPKSIPHPDGVFSYGQRMKVALSTVRALRIHGCPRWLRASPRSFCLHYLATLTPRLTALVLRDYTGEMAPHLARMLNSRGAGPVLCPALAAVTYSTLALACTVHEGRFVPPPCPASSASESMRVPATLVVILAATATRAHALGQALPRLVFCCPAVARDYVVEDTCGVERVEVRGTDAWAAPDSDGVFERWAEARYACPIPTRAQGGDGDGHGHGHRRAVQDAHKLARAARKAEQARAARTPEEEYDALWGAARPRAPAEGLRVSLSLSGPSMRPRPPMAVADELVSGLLPGPPRPDPSLHYHTAAGPGATVPVVASSGEGAVGDSESESGITVLASFGLICYLLSLWFVRLLLG